MKKKSSNELIDLIIEGKSKYLEFCDENLDDPNIAKHLVAFCNADGGNLVFGVDDNGEVVGLINHEIEHRVADIAANLIFPPISPKYYEVTLTGKTIGVVEVLAGKESPYYYAWQGVQNYMVRSGKTTRKITANQLQSMLKKSGGLRYEVSPVGNASFEDLDQQRLAGFLQRTRQIDLTAYADKKLLELLTNLELVVQSGKQYHPTVAGVLLFANEPQKFIQHAKIGMITYSGPAKSQDSLLMEVTEPFVAGINPESGEISANGAIESIIEIIKDHWDDHQNTKSFPAKVIQEIIVNTLIHRDYSDTESNIVIEVFTDHIEFTSPGLFHENIDLDKIGIGMKSIRNPLLYNLLAEAGYFNKNDLPVYNLLTAHTDDSSIKKFVLEPREKEVHAVLFIK